MEYDTTLEIVGATILWPKREHYMATIAIDREGQVSVCGHGCECSWPLVQVSPLWDGDEEAFWDRLDEEMEHEMARCLTNCVCPKETFGRRFDMVGPN